MPSFTKGGSARTPFGRNVYVRSTGDMKRETATFAKAAIPTVTIDGESQKVLQPGTVLARITSGDDVGKVGVYDSNVRAESVSIAVDATGGTWTATFNGDTTAALAFNITAANLKLALESLPDINIGDLAVSGGPGSSGGGTPYVIAFTSTGQYGQTDAPAITTAAGSLTGGASTATVTTTAGGTDGTGATDGRGDPANIIGLCDTFLPWQLLYHDEPIAYTYECAAVADWCFEYVAGVQSALTTATRNAITALASNEIMFV